MKNKKIVVGKQDCGCYLHRRISIDGNTATIHDTSDGSGCGHHIKYEPRCISISELGKKAGYYGGDIWEYLENKYDI